MVRVKKNTGGVKIRVTAKAGGTTVDLSAANGVLAVAAGDNLASLAPMALPAANVTYNAGAATILIPSSTGSFVQALIRVATPPPAGVSRWLVVPDKRHATGDKRGRSRAHGMYAGSG